ncbi:MAG: lipoprotein [Burkholderiales bacterium]|jgi:predicted small lipoprotein YifL
MRSAFLLAVSAALAVLAGCGQRGDLYFRDNPPPGVKPRKAEPYKPVPYPADTDRGSGASEKN